ncbi:ABC transporter ATP-binding protein [Paenibacillus sp. FSL R5-0912]|uniref:ATP-binding cassette domain-containing protein n=1 Tax=Paenibacillus sp. FSL R5-0912 TaxID=1536771 RepID=UPI0005AB0ECC|nr:ABC transporter ATP-binding protein [Paenibacillus sp. FSL R5-0912]
MTGTEKKHEAAVIPSGAKLDLSHVSKIFRGGQGVHDISLSLEPGMIHGLIGANGSGKSTLLSLIAGQRFADSGLVTYGGVHVNEHAAALSQICLVKTYERSWENYSLKEIYKFASIFYPYWDEPLARELMDKFQLKGSKNYQQLSRGGQSMAGIIKGLASRAPLTLLDEPVIGLDASMREIFYRTLLEDYSNYPRTFVMTTHLIEEAENLFERMVYLKRGRIAFQGPVEDFAANAVYASGPATVLEKLLGDVRVLHSERLGGKLLLALENLSGPAEHRMLQDQGIELSPVPLQKLFVYLTLRDAENSQGGGNR